MNKENTLHSGPETLDTIEDLTLNEIKAENIKGGFLRTHSFGFGVEREMKESGE